MRMREGRERDEKEDITREELKWIIRKLNKEKATGICGVTSEVSKYGGEILWNWVLEFCNTVWKEKGWPEV